MGSNGRKKHGKTKSSAKSKHDFGIKPRTSQMGSNDNYNSSSKINDDRVRKPLNPKYLIGQTSILANCTENCDCSSEINNDNVNDVGNGKNGLNPKKTVINCSKGKNISLGYDGCIGGYCTEEQVEGMLMKHLEFLYQKAVSKLVDLGYGREVAFTAVLNNGHCFGGMDVLNNIVRNALAYLNGGCFENDGNVSQYELGFTELRQLLEYNIGGMVCLLQQAHPHLSRGNAMWCLLMSDLNLRRASTIEVPLLPSPSNVPLHGSSNVESIATGILVPPEMCCVHGECAFENGGDAEASIDGEIECAKRFNLTPPMKSLLKRNVTAIATDFRSKQEEKQAPSTDEVCQESDTNYEDVSSLLNKFCDLNLDETLEDIGEDQKDEMLLTLVHQVRELEKQVSERKEWAREKAMQAARKLSCDLRELKTLRTEKEQSENLKDLTEVFQDTTMKRRTELQHALRKASSQVDCANATVRQLEIENAEIRAEMEASKLSASESVTASLEVAKREKKYLKRFLACEKQKKKLQDEIAAAKQKNNSLRQQLEEINSAQKEAQAKWRQEVKNKELAMASVGEEIRSKETAEANNKRNLDALRLRIEIDSQRHKDDLQRLEQELSRLKEGSQLSEPSNTFDLFPAENPQHQGSSTIREEPENEGSERKCTICMKDDVSVVFLPCAHQVMCVSCGNNHCKKVKATCPCCRVRIEKSIRVFGIEPKTSSG